MKPDDRYDYGSAGFDGFLSRSIDELDQVNLDSQGPRSNKIAFDRAQLSGAFGDSVAIGNVRLNGKDGTIDLLEDGRKGMIIGRDSAGNQVVKVAKEGFNADTAGNNELIFNSQQNTLKIVSQGTGTVGTDGSTTNWVTIPHDLGFAPIPFVFLNNVNISGITTGSNAPLPMYSSLAINTTDKVVEMQTWLHAVANDVNLQVILFNSLGTSFNLNFKYYLLQETSD